MLALTQRSKNIPTSIMNVKRQQEVPRKCNKSRAEPSGLIVAGPSPLPLRPPFESPLIYPISLPPLPYSDPFLIPDSYAPEILLSTPRFPCVESGAKLLRLHIRGVGAAPPGRGFPLTGRARSTHRTLIGPTTHVPPFIAFVLNMVLTSKT